MNSIVAETSEVYAKFRL